MPIPVVVVVVVGAVASADPRLNASSCPDSADPSDAARLLILVVRRRCILVVFLKKT